MTLKRAIKSQYQMNKSVPRRNCLDAGRTFKRRLERTHPGQMKMPRAPRKEKPPEREFKYVQEMVNLLGTPFERVFKLDERQATFISPALMQGVPVGKMEEHGEHWQSSWRSIDIWKDHTKDPRNAFVKRTKGECERVMANLGPDSEFHPNQLLTAVALHSDGLCNSRLPVDICPYLETLQPLHDAGVLKMRPLDFIRWRIIDKFNRRKRHVWPKPVKSAVRNLRFGSVNTRDHIMRYAMRLGSLDPTNWDAFMDEYRSKNSTSEQDED
ncbi:unnamed protein product [Clonostachys rosea f. rosea IK726]|uniref:Uncharacterized protein n=1 Tax=Clonostachys rosea f. rosea IK726 TaxID=1349383 RepID=A0ACA9U263_BIOOC|nr:unnamed protein product [Clonostachys rosea f. rosea IK726]